MDSNHRKNTLTELQSVPFSHSGTPPVFFVTTLSFSVLVKECAKVIVFFIMSKAVSKKNAKKIKKRKEIREKGEMETKKGESLLISTFLLSSFVLYLSYFFSPNFAFSELFNYYSL
jgi:polyferredoxin